MAELKKDGIRAAMSEKVERETLKRMSQRQEKRDPVLWYHMLAKGWDCPGHDDSYESTSCIGAKYVGRNDHH